MLDAIELTPQEESLLVEVKEAERLALLEHNRERTVRAGQAARELMELLMARQAIPEVRLRFFTDAAFHGSNSKASRYELFKRNAGSKERVLEHPNFYKYLLFFVLGAKLPADTKVQFSELAADGMRDHGALEKLARKLCKHSNEDKAAQAEEFFKLAMDCGCELMEAMRVRRAVMSVR